MESADAPGAGTPGAQELRGSVDRSLGRASDAALRTGNRLTLLQHGTETYEKCLEEIRRAESWIHMNYFIFKSDDIGRRFAEAIKAKARESVAVRVLYDWMGNFAVPGDFWRDLRRARVETRVVNAPAPGRTLGLIRRDHRKILGVYGRYASVSGLCIADQWLGMLSGTRRSRWWAGPASTTRRAP